jgi:hypothetical protein
MNTLKKYWAVIITMLFMTLISCASFFAGYKVGELHNTVKWPESVSQIDSISITNSNKIVSAKYIDTIETTKPNVLIGDMDIESKVQGSVSTEAGTTIASCFKNIRNINERVINVEGKMVSIGIGDQITIDSNGLKFGQGTFYVDTTETTKEDSTWFERNFDMPYLSDTTLKIVLAHQEPIPEIYSDTFKTVSLGCEGSIENFRGTTLNIHAYPVEQFKSDTAFKEYEDSTGTYRIKYVYGYSGWSPLVIGSETHYETHYEATITVYRLFPETGYQPLAEFDGTYVEHGCFEDNPKYWVNKALKQ